MYPCHISIVMKLIRQGVIHVLTDANYLGHKANAITGHVCKSKRPFVQF